MIQLQLFTLEQLDAVCALEQICFPDDPWSKAMFEAELNNPLSVFITAIDEEDGMLIGYGGVWLMYDAGNITNIAIHPDYRREGIGTCILNSLSQICLEKGMETITLEVRESNVPAQALYTARGFFLCGRRKNYYHGKEDALIMTKVLKGEEDANSCH